MKHEMTENCEDTPITYEILSVRSSSSFWISHLKTCIKFYHDFLIHWEKVGCLKQKLCNILLLYHVHFISSCSVKITSFLTSFIEYFLKITRIKTKFVEFYWCNSMQEEVNKKSSYHHDNFIAVTDREYENSLKEISLWMQIKILLWILICHARDLFATCRQVKNKLWWLYTLLILVLLKIKDLFSDLDWGMMHIV